MEFKLKVWFEVDTHDKSDEDCEDLYFKTKEVIDELEKLIEQKLRSKLPIADFYLDIM